MMRFADLRHGFYVGIYLHARSAPPGSLSHDSGGLPQLPRGVFPSGLSSPWSGSPIFNPHRRVHGFPPFSGVSFFPGVLSFG
jgi:hypothetical protein